MGKIYDEFLTELAELREKCKNDPVKELNELLILALEREELVATSYRDSMLNKQIQQMPIPNDFKEIIRHCFIWIWKDEEMHTDYVRSGLIKTHQTFPTLKIYWSDFQGFIGGWAGSVMQLMSFRQAPLSYTFAKFIVWFGSLGGKVPKEVAKELKKGLVRDFCAFNVDAEKTAWICWARIVELAEKDDRFSGEHLRDFKKIVQDEHNHGNIFQLIYDSLDERDALRDGVSLEQLVHSVRKVNNYFLPRAYREQQKLSNPLGSDPMVWCDHDTEGVGSEQSLQKLLSSSNLRTALEQKAEQMAKPLNELEVLIKVSFTMGYTRNDYSPILTPDRAAVLIIWLKQQGISRIRIIDVHTLYSRFYHNREVLPIAEYYGFDQLAEIVDGSQDLEAHHYDRGIGVYQMCRAWKQADFRISFGKLKSHPTEMAMLSISNLEWLVGDCEDFIFADKMIDRTNTTMVLLDEYPPDYALLDAYDQIPDGLVGVMGSLKTISPRRFYASADALSLDETVMQHLGMKELPQSSVLKTIEYWFGGKGEQVQVIGSQEPIAEWRGPTRNWWWSVLNFLSYPVYMFFSQRGSLFLPEMDTEAFPEKKQVGWFLQLLRRINMRIIGLR